MDTIDKPLARLRKKEKTLINKTKYERRDTITDNAEIQKIIRDYYEQLNVHKLDHL